MNKIVRNILFAVCVIGALLLKQTGPELAFYIVAGAAFVNMFSRQFLCALDGQCEIDGNSNTLKIIYNISSLIGGGGLALGIWMVWLN